MLYVAKGIVLERSYCQVSLVNLDCRKSTMMADARADLATKDDLSEFKADLIKWNVGAMAILTAIFAALVRLG